MERGQCGLHKYPLVEGKNNRRHWHTIGVLRIPNAPGQSGALESCLCPMVLHGRQFLERR